MNIENMTALRAHLQAVKDGTNGPVGFNMARWVPSKVSPPISGLSLVDQSGHNCGTICCLAGHVAVMQGFNLPDGPQLQEKEIKSWAGQFLGLNYWEAGRLFIPIMSLRKITLDDALKVIDYVIETGEISWKNALGVDRFKELGGF